MANDWIPWTIGLPEKPEIFGLARAMNVSRLEAAATCMKLWEWTDANTPDGCAEGMNLSDLDAIVNRPGFGNALAGVGWVKEESGGLRFPNFDRWNTSSTKARLKDRKRKQEERASEKCPENTGQNADKTRTKSGPHNSTVQDKTRQDRTGQNPTEVFDAWNSLGSPFPKIVKATEKRMTSCRLRLEDSWWREHWREALPRIKNSTFCRGENDRGWVADIEFFLRPDSVAKTIEGKYDDRIKKTGQEIPQL